MSVTLCHASEWNRRHVLSRLSRWCHARVTLIKIGGWSMARYYGPKIFTICADCGRATLKLSEWYMVKDRVWKQAWAGRLKSWHILPGQQILCIGCLEGRLGRKLTRKDFKNLSVNDPEEMEMSDRLLDRITGNGGDI